MWTLDRPPGGGAIPTSITSTDPRLVAAVQAGVEETRLRNGLTLGWLRVGLRLLTLAVWLAQASTGGGRTFLVSAAVNLGHLAIAGAVLWLLHRRWQVGRVLLLAAAVDVLVVMVAGLRAVDAPDPASVGMSVGYLMGVMMLVLLLAGLTLPRGQVTALALSATAFQGWLGLRAGLPPAFVVVSVVTLAAFALALAWAGSWMAALGARLALEGFAGRQEAAHREALAEGTRALEARGEVLARTRREADSLMQLVVHDLKNPLSSLLQLLQLAGTRVRAAPGLEGAASDLALATEEGERLAVMIQDLLVMGRLELGVMAPRPQAVPLHPLLAQATRAVEARARERSVALSIEAPEDLLVPLDLDLARRLVEHLLLAALRHVDRGDRVEASAAVAGGELCLAVRRTGPPVPETARATLFEKQAATQRGAWNHPGIGLYLARLVAEAHGGRLRLGEAPGWSASYEARIPLP